MFLVPGSIQLRPPSFFVIEPYYVVAQTTSVRVDISLEQKVHIFTLWATHQHSAPEKRKQRQKTTNRSSGLVQIVAYRIFEQFSSILCGTLFGSSPAGYELNPCIHSFAVLQIVARFIISQIHLNLEENHSDLQSVTVGTPVTRLRKRGFNRGRAHQLYVVR